MHPCLKFTALGLTLACAGLDAHAAESSDLAVQGVIRPTACAITLASNGVVDFGTIPAADLSDTDLTQLPTARLDMQIQCDSSAQFGIKVVDNRAGTAEVPEPSLAQSYYGLGTAAGANIGSYRIVMKVGTGDGKNASPIASVNGGSSWGRLDNKYYVAPNTTYAWSTSASNVPSSMQTLAETLTIDAFVAAKQNLPVDNEIPLDGAATISLVYL